MKLEPCDILFYYNDKDDNIFSRFIHYWIKKITKSKFYHVSYFVNDNTVFQANGFQKAGFRELPDPSKYKVKRLKLPLEIRRKILYEIISTQGDSYDYGEIVSLFFRKGLGINVFYDNPKEYICSGELFAAVKKITGIELLDQSTSDVSPEDLWESEWLIEVTS